MDLLEQLMNDKTTPASVHIANNLRAENEAKEAADTKGDPLKIINSLMKNIPGMGGGGGAAAAAPAAEAGAGAGAAGAAGGAGAAGAGAAGAGGAAAGGAAAAGGTASAAELLPLLALA